MRIMVDALDQLRTALAARYRIEREVGSGGMATVYLAHDVKHGRPVALKVMKPEVRSELGAARFLREIEFAARLTHPHILPLHDSGEVEGFLYYVMPYIEGATLRERLDREKQLTSEEAMSIASDVASALDYAHDHGVVHRDIKPENILLSSGKAIVADFGVSRAVQSAGDLTFTTTGVVLGTVHYMSPEQASGSEVDGRSDLYSLGCVLYEMLAGQAPYVAPAAEGVVHQHMQADVPDVALLRPSVDPGTREALQRAMAKAPADRFATGAQFIQALGQRTSHDRRRIGWAAAVGVIALALAGWWLASRQVPGQIETSPTAVAVLPFTIRGSDELAYLDEGMVVLLSTTLDGAGEMRSVDPRALLGYVGREKLETSEPETGRMIAERFGAGLYVLGDLLAVNDQLQLHASLYDLSRGATPFAQATVDGTADELIQLVDELTAKLLVARSEGPAKRGAQLAAATSKSLPALKAYLRGEYERRHLRYPDALEWYRRAVAEDSSFALAWFRLGQIGGDAKGELGASEGMTLRRESYRLALRHADRLPWRERTLLAANVRRDLHAESREAERLGNAIISRYRDDLEGHLFLAETQFHYGPFHGRSQTNARAALEEALALDPLEIEALDHLAFIALLERRVADADSLFAVMQGLEPEEAKHVAIQVLQAFSVGDADAQQRAVDAFARSGGVRTVSDLALVGEIRGSERLVAARSSNEQMRNWRAPAAILKLAQGQWREAKLLLAEHAQLDELGAVTHLAYLSSMPFLPVTPDEIRELQTRIEEWDPSAPPEPRSYLIRFADHLPQVQTYLLGLLSVRAGRNDDALQYARVLDGLGGSEEARATGREFAAGVRACVELARGRPQEALERLQKAPPSYYWGPTTAFRLRLYERYAMAEALFALGRYEDSLGWYESLVQSSIWEVTHVGPAHLKLGRIHEELGNTEKAIQHYAKLIDLWRDCDPELLHMLDAARVRLEALRVSEG